MTPTAGPDGTLYVAGWTAGGDSDDRIKLPSFADVIARYDANKNGTIEENELPAGPAKERFSMLDRNKDGHVTRAEWEYGRQRFEAAKNCTG